MKPSDFNRSFFPARFSIDQFDPKGERGQRGETYFFHVLHALWNSDCEDVQKMCLRSLTEGWYTRESCATIRSESPHAASCHKNAKDTIVTLIVEHNEKLALKVTKLYFEFCCEAVIADRNIWNRKELPKVTESETYKSEALRFILRLLVSRRPRFLYEGDRNIFFMKHEMFKFLLGLIEEGKLPMRDSILCLRVYSKQMLWILQFNKRFVVREDFWGPYERLFGHVVRTKRRYLDNRTMFYIREMARMFREDFSFEEHESFGPLLKKRTEDVCIAVMRFGRTRLEVVS